MHEALDLSSTWTLLMLQKLNARWIINSSKVGSSLLSLQRKIERNQLNFQGRELTVVFAEENRKKPTEMRARDQGSARVYHWRRSPPRYSCSPRYFRSPPPRYGRSHSRGYYFPPKRRYSRSVSPQEKRHSREKSFSQSPVPGYSPPYNGPRNHSGSPLRERSPYGSRSRSQSPGYARSRSPSRSPYPSEYPRDAVRD